MTLILEIALGVFLGARALSIVYNFFFSDGFADRQLAWIDQHETLVRRIKAVSLGSKMLAYLVAALACLGVGAWIILSR